MIRLLLIGLAIMFPDSQLLADEIDTADWSIDDWIGLESPDPAPPASLHLGWQQDEASSNSYFTAIQLPLGSHFSVDLAYSDSRFSDGVESLSSRSQSIALHGYSSQGFEFSLSATAQGESQVLQMQDSQLQLGYNAEQLLVAVAAKQGDLNIYTRSSITDDRIPQKYSSDYNSLSVTLAFYPSSNSQLLIAAEQYDYDKNISGIDDSRLLQLLLKPAVFSHSGLLIDFESSISYRLLTDFADWTAGYSNTTSALDQSDSDSLTLAINLPVTNSLDLGFSYLQTLHPVNSWAIGSSLDWYF